MLKFSGSFHLIIILNSGKIKYLKTKGKRHKAFRAAQLLNINKRKQKKKGEKKAIFLFI